MIKFLNIQMYVYVRTNDEQSASARYIILRERFRCILFALYYLPKCRENYGDSFRVIYGIYDVTAKILVVSTTYVYTMNITHQFILNSV